MPPKYISGNLGNQKGDIINKLFKSKDNGLQAMSGNFVHGWKYMFQSEQILLHLVQAEDFQLGTNITGHLRRKYCLCFRAGLFLYVSPAYGYIELALVKCSNEGGPGPRHNMKGDPGSSIFSTWWCTICIF